MSRRARALACALLLAGCRMIPEGGEGASPYLRALVLPAVGAEPHDWRVLPGQVVLVTFFATWCFPCLAEIPQLESLQREYGPRGFRVVAVGMDLDGERVLGPFAEHYALPYAIVVADERIRAGESPFGAITALPTAFLLDREGQVSLAWQGVAGHTGLAQTIEKLLRR